MIIFEPLRANQIRRIVDIQIARLKKQLEANHLEFEVTDAALGEIATRGYDPAYGARPLSESSNSKCKTHSLGNCSKRKSRGNQDSVDFRDGEFTFETGV